MRYPIRYSTQYLTGLALSLIFLFPVSVFAALVNINTADAVLLDTLSGIGPTKAAAIIEYRTQNGPFTTIEDIQNVSGIGPVTFANIKDSITVDDANTVPQLPTPQAGSKKVQAVAPPIISPTNIQTHEEAVRAPAGATELAPAGAALPTPPAKSRASGLFSLWTLGLLGVIVLAGGAFVFL